jgi:hypothetical protein
MICTYCRTENTEDCLYCPNCGKPAVLAVEALSFASDSSQTNVAVDTHQSSASSEFAAASPTIGPSVAEGPSTSVDMPGQQNAKLAKANLSRLRRNWKEATELSIEVLRESPADPAAHSLLGDIYRDQNRMDEAVRWYRMALELSPNPFDQANLQKLERQLAGRDSAYRTTSPGQQSSFDPLTGSLSGGTSALMGISPQKWLKGITISALGFLCVFVIYLIALPTKKIASVPRAISSDDLVSGTPIGADGLPPARLGGPTSLPAGEQASSGSSVGRVAGSGLPPDLGSATVPVMQPPAGNQGLIGAGVGPADVKPGSPLAPGNGSGSNRVGVLSPGASSAHNNSLSGGVEQGRVDSGNGEATINLIASNAATPRDVLVRNIYRSARTIFSNDSSLQRATVIVHTETSDGAPLLSADIDRASAITADPGNDDLISLTGRLRFH